MKTSRLQQEHRGARICDEGFGPLAEVHFLPRARFRSHDDELMPAQVRLVQNRRLLGGSDQRFCEHTHAFPLAERDDLCEQRAAGAVEFLGVPEQVVFRRWCGDVQGSDRGPAYFRDGHRDLRAKARERE